MPQRPPRPPGLKPNQRGGIPPKNPAGTRAARVRRCAELLATGQWVTGVTAYDLAKEWGLTSRTSPNYVEHLACEARTLLDLTMEKERGAFVAEALVTLQTIRAAAIGDKKYGDAVKAVLGIVGIGEKFLPGMAPLTPPPVLQATVNEPHRFIVELTSPERPPPCPAPPPPPGASSPQPDDPATP